MGIFRHLYKALALVFLLGAPSALAADPLHFVGRYDFDWNGIALGTLVLGIDETQDTYNLHLLVNSTGVVNLFTHHVSDTVANGTRTESGYIPQLYESHYKTKNKPRHIKLAFDAKGAVIEEIVEPPEDRSERPEVPHNLKDGSYDPLTGLMELRAGNENWRGFDAKHLFAVKAVKGDKVTLQLPGGSHAAFAYILSRAPLAGMTAKETKDFKKGEPPLALYFSDDARHIPLAVSVPLYFGQVRGVLVKECAGWEACIK